MVKGLRLEAEGMDELSLRVLTRIQREFPLTSSPYRDLAKELNSSEKTIREKIGEFKQRRIIRRLGAVFDPWKLGYKSTLCAIKVPEERLEEVAEAINAYPNVTHNYSRKHEYNLWFTLIAEFEEQIQDILEEIQKKTGIRDKDILNLPAINLFKLEVNFEV